MVLAQLLSVIFPALFAVDPNCNFYQDMQVGPTYYVYNKEYPNKYGPNKNCLWIAAVPEGYVIEAICQIEIPNTKGCIDDRLLISPTGQPDLANAEVYCGYGNKTIHSEYTKISIGLQSSYMSDGGRFLCTLRAKANPSKPCECGWRNMRRIVGGEETGVNEFPMMAGLVDFEVRDVFCGATIIAERYAVTAAHCWKSKDVSKVGLLVGEHDITSGSETNATALLLLQSVVKHPGYNESVTNSVHDIAVVKTQKDILFGLAVGPVCLPFIYYQQSFEGQSVWALGWGTTEFTGPKSDVLLKTDIQVLSYSECYNKVGGTIDVMCTYYPGHDACQSDSGGPILWNNQNSHRLYLVGVISFGYGCASQKPAVNTRVTSYLSWILSVTPGATFCNMGPEFS